MQQYDVAVIGLGAIGAATLYHLAKAGPKVIGIDRYHPPHDHGSSHGDTRITRLSVGEGEQYLPIVRRAHEIWRELERVSGESLFEQCGALVFSSTHDHSADNASGFTNRTMRLALDHGIEHEILSANQIRERFPQFRSILDGTVGYYEPSGGYLRPERCVATQLNLAESHGASLHVGETVLSVESFEQGVRITTDKRTFLAHKAIVSVGMWTRGLLTPHFDYLLRICRQKLFWFELEAGAGFGEPSPVFIARWGASEHDMSYGFPPLPGENSVKIATEQYDVESSSETLNRLISSSEAQHMYDAHVAGKLTGVTRRVVKSAVCAYTVTPDSNFIIDEHPEIPGVYVASACSGHGFKHSTALGEALAQLCTQGQSDLDLSAFRLKRFIDAKPGAAR